MNKIIEPDLGLPELKMYSCESDKANVFPPAENAVGSPTGTNKAIIEPSIKDMQLEIAVIEKAIAELEKKRDKVVSEKHNLLTSDGDYHSIEGLHSKEKAITAELAELSKKLSGTKQSLNWKLQDKENFCLALSELAKYEAKTAEAIQAGENILSMLKKINEDVVLLAGDTKQFLPIQQRRYDASWLLQKNLRTWGLTSMEAESGTLYGIDNIRCDTSPAMLEFKKALRVEMIKTMNNLQLIESILWDCERVLNFERFNSGVKPDGLPSY